jgi:hypothetical protein
MLSLSETDPDYVPINEGAIPPLTPVPTTDSITPAVWLLGAAFIYALLKGVY